jgi:predicted RNA-binding Zn-ribbon protein involved in translation (DUF1610 family)
MTALTAVVAALVGVLTNYATASQPAWLAERPVLTWLALAVVVAIGIALALAGGWSKPEAVRQSRWAAFRRGARLVHCLKCGRTLWAELRGDHVVHWQCPACGSASASTVDDAGRLVLSTEGVGSVRETQRTVIRGFMVRTLESEVLTSHQAPARPGRADGPSLATVKSTVDEHYRAEFRAAFLRSALADRRALIAVWCFLGAVFVPLGIGDGWFGVVWRLVVAVGIGAAVGCLLVAVVALLAFNRWTRSEQVRYWWHQRPEGTALAVLVLTGDRWHFVALRTLGGRTADYVGVELVADVCAFADRHGMTLSILASHAGWLVAEFRFERDSEQKRRHRTALTRKPVATPTPHSAQAPRPPRKKRRGRKQSSR